MFFKKYRYDDIMTIELKELKKRIKIVVIDDDENSFPIIQMQSFGFTLEYWAEIDAEKLNRLEEGAFDIIVLDIFGVVNKSLGDLTGLDILKSLKHKNPKQLIIAFSGSSYEIDKGEFWKLADDFIKKPISAFDTKERLESILSDNYSINKLLSKIKETVSKQVQDIKKESEIENIIVKAIFSRSNKLDLVKLTRIGIQDTASIMTLVTTIISIIKD